MKTLAGVLLAFALAAGVGNEAGAQQRTSGTKQVAKASVKKTSESKCVCTPEKSLLVLTGRLTELNSSPTNCVCGAKTTTTKPLVSTGAATKQVVSATTSTKHIAAVSTNKTKHKAGGGTTKTAVASTSMMKTKSYGGYKRVKSTRINTIEGTHDLNKGQYQDILFRPRVDSLNSNLDEDMDRGL